MSFKDQLRKKIEINELAGRIEASMGPPDSGRRVDKELVRQLLAQGGYEKIVERDMELYRLSPSDGTPRLLVLDNDLPIYGTGVEDVVLRKSPLVKEMLNIRNVMKILNDADVVISKKDVSLNTLREELIAGLDLQFTAEDIDDLVYDGRSAFANRYADGVQETLRFMADLLGYVPAPRALQVPHHVIWGAFGKSAGEPRFGPIVLYDAMHNALKQIQQPIDWSKPEDMARYEAVVSGATSADQNGEEVFKALGQRILAG
ncbi:MAG: hypothetical protein V2I40_04260 [Desulfobacteraceae bacterium]|jgi:hypothetical protein|nr:hypothetical protein [Desulfobacteraceae bacterium]